MPKATISLSVSIGGVSVAKNWERDGDHPNPYEVTLPVAQAGELTTRTGDTANVVTLAADHGLVTGDLVDLYWTGGLRYGMEATVDGVEVTLSGGAGSVLPAEDAEIVACKQFVVATSIDGDAAEVLVISLEYADGNVIQLGHVDFRDVSATVKEFDLTANEPLFVDIASDLANPLTGNPITACRASHNDTVNTAALKICTLEDRTPGS